MANITNCPNCGHSFKKFEVREGLKSGEWYVVNIVLSEGVLVTVGQAASKEDAERFASFLNDGKLPTPPEAVMKKRSYLKDERFESQG